MSYSPQIMGVVNVTPDSFSDGGRFLAPHAAIDHGLQLIAEGADILDIGGESTRPGAEPVGATEEMDRILGVIEGLKGAGARLSVDSAKPEVAFAAIRAGAEIWNNVNALRAPDAVEMAASLGCDVILMHMQGAPRTMQAAPHYEDVVAEVEAFLLARAEAVIKAGVGRDRIWIDPGIGFGKSLDHNLDLIRATRRLSGHGFPLVMAASNKRFIADLEDRLRRNASEPDQRTGGTVAVHLWAALQGAAMVRVHDVRDFRQAMDLWRALAP